MPRKTGGGGHVATDAERASMRPRPDAAENVDCDRGDRAARDASMRPRPDAAENKPAAAARVIMSRLQ